MWICAANGLFRADGAAHGLRPAGHGRMCPRPRMHAVRGQRAGRRHRHAPAPSGDGGAFSRSCRTARGGPAGVPRKSGDRGPVSAACGRSAIAAQEGIGLRLRRMDGRGDRVGGRRRTSRPRLRRLARLHTRRDHDCRLAAGRRWREIFGGVRRRGGRGRTGARRATRCQGRRHCLGRRARAVRGGNSRWRRRRGGASRPSRPPPRGGKRQRERHRRERHGGATARRSLRTATRRRARSASWPAALVAQRATRRRPHGGHGLA